MTLRVHFSFIVLVGLAATPLLAEPPAYSLDALSDHPYRFVPSWGHASQMPGSPKHFAPGYGYRIPGFGTFSTLSSRGAYQPLNAFGRRIPKSVESGFRSNQNSLGGPWYYPGWPGNPQLREQSW